MTPRSQSVLGHREVGTTRPWSDAFPDLFTEDRNPLVGRFSESSRIYCATGFSGGGFKNATGYGHIAAYEVLGKQSFEGLEFVHPERFKTR